MSNESVAIALRHSRATGAAKVIMIGIANHDGDGGSWPSIATLAGYANVDERSAQRAVAKLVALGEIRRHEGRGGTATTPDHRRPNLYEVIIECPSWCDRSKHHRDTRRASRVTPALPGLETLSTGVTPASPGDASVTGRGDASVTRNSPSNYPRLIEKNSRVRARERERCSKGHYIIDRDERRRYCSVGCIEDVAASA